MPSTAFIQLGRAGDLVSILPIMRHKALQGRDVHCYVHPEFAPILDGVSYVTPVLRPTHHTDVTNSAAQAVKDGHDEVIACQVNGNESPPPVGCPNFIIEQWSRCGTEYLSRYHTLPLAFDRRDFDAENEVLRRHLPPRNGKPILAYSLTGYSSPNPHWRAMAAYLKCFEQDYQLLDLTELRLASPCHLLPLIEQAAVLIAADSLPLHLGHAFHTPTIALHVDETANPRRPREWYWSEPRTHWVANMTYGQAMDAGGKRRLAEILERRQFSPAQCIARRPENETVSRIHQAVDWWLPEDDGTPRSTSDRRRILSARRTWEHLAQTDRSWDIVFFEAGRDATRTAKDIGDARALPYVKDIIDKAASRAEGDGIIVLTNADTCITPEAATLIRQRLITGPCAFGRRVDVTNADRPMSHAEMTGRAAHAGSDLFAFRASFWREHGHEFPDMLIGAEGWDFVWRHAFRGHFAGAELPPGTVYHEIHAPKWAEKSNVRSSPAQKHNRRLAAEWARRNGLAKALNPASERFLFKVDGTW